MIAKSSNGVEIQEGDVVLYGTGSDIVRCIVDKITYRGFYGPIRRTELGFGMDRKPRPYRWHLRVIESVKWDIGHKFVAKAAERMWYVGSLSVSGNSE